MKIPPSYLRTRELRISIFIRQTTIAIGLTPSTRLNVKHVKNVKINTSHKVYIDRSLAFSRDNHLVDF